MAYLIKGIDKGNLEAILGIDLHNQNYVAYTFGTCRPLRAGNIIVMLRCCQDQRGAKPGLCHTVVNLIYSGNRIITPEDIRVMRFYGVEVGNDIDGENNCRE